RLVRAITDRGYALVVPIALDLEYHNGVGSKMPWNKQVVTRSTTDVNVYRSEGLATRRHDEISSHAIMFHIDENGVIRKGHVYQPHGSAK
ncbi:MAG: hypothetical protein AAF226_19650, partial [Verrucomicrobiota bacterium]